MAAKLSKKQHVALRQIDELVPQRNRDIALGIASIVIMIGVISTYNFLTYSMGVVDEGNMVIRAIIYSIAMVVAGFCGIMFRNAYRKHTKMETLRQGANISRETLEAWKRGEYKG